LKTACLPLLLLLLFVGSCNQQPKTIYPAFYHWKSTLSLSSSEQQLLSSLQTRKLYLRFFDVTVPDGIHAAPVAVVSLKTGIPQNMEVIPVIYITNKTLTALKGNALDTLAQHISHLLQTTAERNHINYREIQIDCDWTGSTRKTYFTLLDNLRALNQGKLLTATIRLHQIKYFKRTGVPPVNRGMLMFYNMGKVESKELNSIFNKEDAEKYTDYIQQYPLPLDVALPVFGWLKHYHAGKLAGLISDMRFEDLQDVADLKKTDARTYTAGKSMFMHGSYLFKGDLLVNERVTPELALDAAKLLAKNYRADSITVTLYHLDSLNLSGYENEDLEDIYSTFR
jgi:hypothetical protein